ncbi:MAG: class A beta-lactamase-related serine hydrolase [Planctomycetia bacterium]|nr:class A beta-lactamase-related serine hydrolase [Planctomycetia bacterium]
MIGLGALTACGFAASELPADDTAVPKPGLEKELAQLEETWAGSFSIEAQRLDAPGHFALRPNTILPTASTCKLFVLCELFRQAEAGIVDLNAPLTWKPEHHRTGDGVLRAMIPGQELSAHNMAILMTVLSDNIATAVLVDLLGPDNIGRSMKTWKLDDSDFFEGLPAGSRAAQMKQPVSTAHDLCSLITRIYRKDILTAKSCEEIIRILRAQRCNDMLARYIPVGEDWGNAPTWIANKTGYGECRVEVGIVKSAVLTMSLSVFFKPHKSPPHRLKSMSDYPPVLAVAHACQAVYEHFATA